MTPCQSLLVYVGDDASSDARLEMACDLADRFDACVIGVAASDPQPPMYDPIGGLGDVMVALREAAEDDVRRARARFDAIVAAAFVVNGGIYRHDFVAGAVVTALMNIGLETGVPCFSVSLKPHNYQPNEVLDAFFFDHFVTKGVEAAHAVRDILALNLDASQ